MDSTRQFFLDLSRSPFPSPEWILFSSPFLISSPDYIGRELRVVLFDSFLGLFVSLFEDFMLNLVQVTPLFPPWSCRDNPGRALFTHLSKASFLLYELFFPFKADFLFAPHWLLLSHFSSLLSRRYPVPMDLCPSRALQRTYFQSSSLWSFRPFFYVSHFF